MRLPHLETLRLDKFNDGAISPYAILSHTWKAGEEMTLGEMQQLNQYWSLNCRELGSIREANSSHPLQALLEKLGYIKIEQFCEAAAKYGFAYGWVDTCRIDKTSSSELSEAINSIYR